MHYDTLQAWFWGSEQFFELPGQNGCSDRFLLFDRHRYLLFFCFIINIVANFNTGFYKEGTLVMDRRDIVMSYLKTWFVPDLVSSFPFMWLMGSNYEFD